MNQKRILRAILKRIIPPLGYILMKFFWYSTKKEFHFQSSLKNEQYIYVCWHGELFISPQVYRSLRKTQKASAMISHHFDGELISRVYKYLDISSVRGSGRRGAKEVFLKAFRAVKKGEEILLTPDGPKGPRHYIYNGAIGLAQKSKLSICTINFTCSNYWQLNSWDKFVIPKPFSKIDFYIEPLEIDDLTLEEAKKHLYITMMKNTII